MNAIYSNIDVTSITTRRKKSTMAASSVVTVTQQNASLIIDEILSQKEEEDITKMLEETSKLTEEIKSGDGKNLFGDEEDEEDGTKGCAKQGWVAGVKIKDKSLEKLSEEVTLDQLNEVFGRIGECFQDLEIALEQYEVSLEFSQSEIKKLKKENSALRGEVKTLENKGRRNEYQIGEVEEKFERLDTITRKKNLVFEGIMESKPGERENTQQIIYDVFDQMKIDPAVTPATEQARTAEQGPDP